MKLLSNDQIKDGMILSYPEQVLYRDLENLKAEYFRIKESKSTEVVPGNMPINKPYKHPNNEEALKLIQNRMYQIETALKFMGDEVLNELCK